MAENSVPELLGRFDGSPGDTDILLDLGTRPRLFDKLERALRQTALDPASFHSVFGSTRPALVGSLIAAYQLSADRTPALWRQSGLLRGFLGIFVLTLGLVEEIDQENSAAMERAPLADQSLLDEIRSIRPVVFGDPSVRAVFERLYQWTATEESAHNSQARAAWDDIDFDSIEFHRRGTTSFLLRAQTRMLREDIAVKCLIYPYTMITPVSEESEGYRARYSYDRPRFVPRLRASSPKWVIMDFVPGPTLREYLDGRAAPGRNAPLIDLGLLRRISVALLDALDELDRYDLHHLDLTPSNIILMVEDGDIVQATLIDMGRNHLYSRSLGLLEGPESVFVAPEIKRDGDGTILSDLYSLGVIFCWLCDRPSFVGPIVPDLLYQQAPALARFVEDLVDLDPNKRLLLADSTEFARLRLRYFRSALVDGIEALEKAEPYAISDERWLLAVMDLYRSRQPVRQYQTWREQRRRSERLSRYSGWLLAWSAVCATNWYLVTTVVFIWALRYWGVESLPPAVDVAGHVTRSQGIPLVDDLRVRDYTLGFSAVNVQTLALALSFALVATKYYQSIYAGLTARALPGLTSKFCEFFMRFNSCWVGGPILVAVLVNPAWWPWCAATGYLGVALNDLFAHLVSTRAISQGSTVFSTVPLHTKQALHSHGEWWRTMMMFSLILFFVAYCLTEGVIGDWWVYAAGIVLVNVVKLYTSNSCRLAPLTRGALARSFTVGERLAALQTRPSRT